MAFTQQEAIIKELDDLLVLAESSTKTIDDLVEAIATLRIRLMTIVVFITALFLASSALTEYYNKTNLFDTAKSGLFVSAITLLTVLTLVMLLYGIFSTNRQLSKAQLNLRVEREVHEPILSLIDDQMGRLKTFHPSPVTLATFEMRIRRLDRTRNGRRFNKKFSPWS